MTDDDRVALAYWNGFSGAWRIPPPLAPAPDDIRWFESHANDPRGAGKPGCGALLLGVTPSVARMRWPAGTSLVAVDWAFGMLRNVWVNPPALAWSARVEADWRQMPLASKSRDIVVGDGCYTALGSFDNAALLNAEIRRVLRQGGSYCLRCFVRPEAPEQIEDMFDELTEGRVPNLDLFRVRLAMAVQGTSSAGVALDDAWKVWEAHVRDVRALAERHRWPEPALRNIERWKGTRMRYFFPSLAEIHALAAPDFEVLACDVPGYEWGERFRRIAMRAL